MEHLKEIPFLDKYPVFRKLAAIGDLQKLTPEEQEYYEEDVKIMRDLYATDKWEKEKIRMEREKMRMEMEKMRMEMEKAVTEGEARGEARGKNKEKLAIAQKLLSLELPLSQIIKATGLTQEQIQGLQK